MVCMRQLVWCGLVLGLLWGGRAHAATLQVKPGDALQAVIDRAQAGDVVEIARGLYQGNFVVNKPLTLRGVGRPTLSGGLVGNTLSVESADVVLEGLIVRDSGDSLKDQNSGIYIRPGSHRAVVQHCTLSYNLFGKQSRSDRPAYCLQCQTI